VFHDTVSFVDPLGYDVLWLKAIHLATAHSWHLHCPFQPERLSGSSDWTLLFGVNRASPDCAAVTVLRLCMQGTQAAAAVLCVVSVMHLMQTAYGRAASLQCTLFQCPVRLHSESTADSHTPQGLKLVLFAVLLYSIVNVDLPARQLRQFAMLLYSASNVDLPVLLLQYRLCPTCLLICGPSLVSSTSYVDNSRVT
jgi:hypothetical protein